MLCPRRYRSLLLLTRNSVWSAATQGFLNLRKVADGSQPVRAHGNSEPWRPLLAVRARKPRAIILLHCYYIAAAPRRGLPWSSHMVPLVHLKAPLPFNSPTYSPTATARASRHTR